MDFRHLLENLVYKFFWSRLATLAWYSYHYMWSLFNSFFFFQLAMKHKCWNTAQSWNLPERNWKGYFSNFYRRSRLLCAFFFQFSGDAFFQFLCRKKCCISTFLTYFCSSFVILLHSPAVLSTCILVVRGVKANRGTGPNDKLIRIKIVIVFPSCTENYLTGCGHMCGNKIQRRGILFFILCSISRTWMLELNTWGCNYSGE